MQGTHTFTNEDIEELTEAVNRLIKMTTQKTAGQVWMRKVDEIGRMIGGYTEWVNSRERQR